MELSGVMIIRCALPGADWKIWRNTEKPLCRSMKTAWAKASVLDRTWSWSANLKVYSMANTKPVFTHTGYVLTSKGRIKVKLRKTPTTWSAKDGKFYNLKDGKRGGNPSLQRLFLETIEPIEESADVS